MFEVIPNETLYVMTVLNVDFVKELREEDGG